MTLRLLYTVDQDGPYQFDVPYASDRQNLPEIAICMAEEYYDQHDGWETFNRNGDHAQIAIYKEKPHKLLGTFVVECEWKPVFSLTTGGENV